MARRATLLKQERSRNPNLLILDAGDTLWGQPLANQTQGRVVVEAMRTMGYAALTLGEMDLQLGLPALRQRGAEAGFPFLGANLSGDLPVKPYTLVTLGDQRIAILGLVNGERPQVTVPGGTVTISDPLAAAQRYVPELRRETNMIIVLSHLGLEMDQRLAREVPGITVIVGGHSKRIMQPPLRVGETIIVQAGFNGEGVGLLRLMLDSQGKVITYQGEFIYLTEGVPDDQEMQALLRRYRQ